MTTRTTQETKRTIAIDFDGVLHSYKSGWQGEDVIQDPPTEGAREFVSDLMGRGFEVVVYSTRAKTVKGHDAMRAWLEKYEFPWIKITGGKPPAVLYIDDRAFRFDGEWERVLEFIELNPGLPSATAEHRKG